LILRSATSTETETCRRSFRTGTGTVSYIADTSLFPVLVDHYTGNVFILNVVRYTNPDKYEVDHLNGPSRASGPRWPSSPALR
jgi:hypothetical protein